MSPTLQRYLDLYEERRVLEDENRLDALLEEMDDAWEKLTEAEKLFIKDWKK